MPADFLKDAKFDNGKGIAGLIEDGIKPLREYVGMVADYAEASLENDQRLWMIKNMMLDHIDEIEDVLRQFKYEAEEAAAELANN